MAAGRWRIPIGVVFLLLLSSGQVSEAKTCPDTVNTYVPITRHYCIGLDTLDWDYAPASSQSQADLLNISEQTAQLLLTNSLPNIGKIYHKALLRQYPYQQDACQWDSSPLTGPETLTGGSSSASASANHRRRRRLRHGLLGPTLHGVVGDTLLVHFRNQAETLETFTIEDNGGDDDYARHLTFNLIPHGLTYDSHRHVSYQQETLYTWYAPTSSGPSGETSGTTTGEQFSSNVWMYTSQVHDTSDLHTGLVGPIVIVDPLYASPASASGGTSLACDIDEEAFLLLGTFSESLSWLFKYNLYTALSVSNQETVRYDPTAIALNTKPSLNGLLFGNLNPQHGMVFSSNSRVRWYVLSIGPALTSGDSGMREVQWAGHHIITTATDSVMSPQLSLTVATPGYAIGDMETGSVTGTWLVSCVNEREMESGMTGTYQVTGSASSSSGEGDTLSDGGVAGIVIMTLVLCCCLLPWLCYRQQQEQRDEKEGGGFSLSDCSTHSNDPLAPTDPPPAGGRTGTPGDLFQRGQALLSHFKSQPRPSSATSGRRFVISGSDGGGEEEEDYVGDSRLTLSDVRDQHLHHQPRPQAMPRPMYQSHNPLHEGAAGGGGGKFVTRAAGERQSMGRLTELTGVPSLADNPAFSIDSSEDRL